MWIITGFKNGYWIVYCHGYATLSTWLGITQTKVPSAANRDRQSCEHPQLLRPLTAPPPSSHTGRQDSDLLANVCPLAIYRPDKPFRRSMREGWAHWPDQLLPLPPPPPLFPGLKFLLFFRCLGMFSKLDKNSMLVQRWRSSICWPFPPFPFPFCSVGNKGRKKERKAWSHLPGSGPNELSRIEGRECGKRDTWRLRRIREVAWFKWEQRNP